MSEIKVNSIVDASGGSTVQVNGYTPTMSNMAGRNLVINGAMQVAQRGSSVSVSDGSNEGYQTVDRFQIQLTSTSNVYTFSQDADAPSGFSKSLKVNCTTSSAVGTATSNRIDYRIEGQDLALLGFGTSAAKELTLSFWVKSNKTGNSGIWLQNNSSSVSMGKVYAINSADTWEQKTITFPADPVNGFTYDNTSGLLLRFAIAMGTNYTSGTLDASWTSDVPANRHAGMNVHIGESTSDYINITGVQLEAGSVATPFEHRQYGQELALCQRYYFKWLNNTGSSRYSLGLQAYSSSGAFGKLLDLPVTMRATPTCATSGTFQPINATGSSMTAFSGTSINTPSNQTLSTGAWTGSSGLVAGNITTIEVANNAYIEASAEL